MQESTTTPSPNSPKKEEAKLANKDEAKEVPKKKRSLDPRTQVKKLLKILEFYQVPIIIIAISVLLSLTALRMMHYANPDADEGRIEANSTKFKQVRINQKIVEKVRELGKDAPPIDHTQTGRINPFSEDVIKPPAN
jgi:hypothetical protein